MSSSKENPILLNRTDYIRYLQQEGQRKGIHKSPNFYSELIKFINSPQGQEGLNKFIHLNPKRVGVTVISSINPFRRAF
jgi:hypothetical protein